MDVEEIALHLYVRRRIMKKKRKKRKFWVHPFVANRFICGVFLTLYDDLRKYPNKFFNYVRMSIASFDELLSLCKNDLSKEDIILRKSITTEEKLVVTLRYLGSGCSFMELHYYFRLGYTTITTLVREVCVVVCKNLATCLTLPTNKEEWKELASGFETHSNFPHCIGAIDGKHIRVIKPTDSGSLYYNYKNYLSIVLVAVCDANYNFIYTDIGAYGKSSDSAVFNDTSLYNKLVNQSSLKLPESTKLSENNPYSFPYVFVGDEAFGLHTHIMRPYGGNNVSHTKKIFNYRLSRARRYIECTFGILSNKWRIFHRPLNMHIDLAKSIVKSCCLLHNLVRIRDGYSYDDTLEITGFEDGMEVNMNLNRGGRSAQSTRDEFANYFVTENVLSRQNRCIH